MVIRVKKDSQHRHKLTKKAYRISLNRQIPNANNSVIDIHYTYCTARWEKGGGDASSIKLNLADHWHHTVVEGCQAGGLGHLVGTELLIPLE